MYNLKFVMNNLSGHCQFVSQWSGHVLIGVSDQMVGQLIMLGCLSVSRLANVC